MIDMEKAIIEFENYLDNYDIKEDPSFKFKIIHTFKVINNCRMIATNLNLSSDEICLMELIGLLHDIGRFEEIKVLNEFDSVKFDHAKCAVDKLFKNNLIRKFVVDTFYDNYIEIAIRNHNKFEIENNLDDKSLLYCKILRDADKLDIFRVLKDENVEVIFKGKIASNQEIENSILSINVYNSIINKKCVKISDRVTPLDYWVCVLAFIFDFNYKESFEIIKHNNYIDVLIDRFDYKNKETRDKMGNVKMVLNNYINDKLK